MLARRKRMFNLTNSTEKEAAILYFKPMHILTLSILYMGSLIWKYLISHDKIVLGQFVVKSTHSIHLMHIQTWNESKWQSEWQSVK